MLQQIPLDLGLQESLTFDNYHAGENQEIVHAIANAGQQFVFIHATSALGKTHLLQAACYESARLGARIAYLPLIQLKTHGIQLLENLEYCDLIGIDDIDQIAGQREWEIGLMELFNQIRQQQSRLIVSAQHAPQQIDFELADLRSRLSWGVTYQLQPLTDQDKLQVLQQRADQRGFLLPIEVGRYLLKHYPRDMNFLFAVLQHLEMASLSEQRKLTIPFSKSVLKTYQP